MKKLTIIFLACLSGSFLTGQSNLNFFLSPTGGAGLRTQPAEIYWNHGIGWGTDFSYLRNNPDTIVPTPFHYKWGLDFGLSWRDQLFVFTGLNYTTRHDNGIVSCDVCGLVTSGIPRPLKHSFWEIPIGINYILTTRKRLSPFVGTSLIYTKSAKEDLYQSWAFQWRVGASVRIYKRTSLQLAFYTQSNRRNQVRPHYIFREAGAQLSVVQVFRKSE